MVVLIFTPGAMYEETVERASEAELDRVVDELIECGELEDGERIRYKLINYSSPEYDNFEEIRTLMSFCYDKYVILEACKRVDVKAVWYAPGGIKNDKDFMLEVLKINFNAILFIGPALVHNKDFILEVSKMTEERVASRSKRS